MTPEAKRRAVQPLVTGGWLSQRGACKPRYGYLLLHALLRQEDLVINRKRTYGCTARMASRSGPDGASA